MLRLLVAEETKQATITLFDVAENIIGYPVIEFITSNIQICISPFK